MILVCMEIAATVKSEGKKTRLGNKKGKPLPKMVEAFLQHINQEKKNLPSVKKKHQIRVSKFYLVLPITLISVSDSIKHY